MRLFHFSEDGSIARFEPRASGYTAGPVVWAVGEDGRRTICCRGTVSGR